MFNQYGRKNHVNKYYHEQKKSETYDILILKDKKHLL